MVNAFVIGPAKSGTTLMITLLDNHPEFSVIPLEVKFYASYKNYKISSNQTTSYNSLNQFFLEDSKISFLGSQNSREVDIMNSGHVDFANVDFKKFKKKMDDKVAEYRETDHQQSVLPKYIEDVHQVFSQVLHGKSKQGFALKEGCHGLPFIDSMQMDFENAKIIVMVRDPRDAFSSYKSISNLKSKGHVFPSFAGNLSLFCFLFDTSGTTFLSYMDYFNDTKNVDSVLFVRYEDLAENTDKEMHRVSRFLGVEFSNSMLEPTTAGKSWGGNPSTGRKLDGVVNSRRNKWPEILSEEEISLIEFFLGKYFHKHNYSKINKKLSKIGCIASIRFLHFGAPVVHWKDFLRPYVRMLRHLSFTVLMLRAMIKRIISS